VYDVFVGKLVEIVKGYTLGDPRKTSTTLGPVISTKSAETIRAHIAEAINLGARPLVDNSVFTAAKEGNTYVAPQVLVNVDHKMKVMSEETFGPVVGVQKIKSDAEALALINDSKYGLTCSIWTRDEATFALLVPDIEAGTVFMNRCDYLDPALCWTGRKESGRGVSLSKFGYDQLTRPKSVHIRIRA